jgi:FemAB-related protein (PEP-CTERM system-associated)
MISADISNITVSDNLDANCADFIRAIPNARLCHSPEWVKMVEKVFGHKGHYFVAHENGEICGVLPLSYVRSRLFGNRLVSQAFSDYGGPLAINPETINALYKSAIDLAKKYGCKSIEFRNTTAMPYDLHLRTDKVCMHLPLAPDPEIVWKGLRPQIRNRIRQAEKEGIIITNGRAELLDDFYRLWTIRMRELGTPCYSRRLFSAILDTFPNDSRIFLAHSGDKIAAAFFVYNFNGCAHSRWGAALREFDSLSPNYLLNWNAIEFYCKAGMKIFDFGRSTEGSGQHTFKKRWGATTIQLNWQYWTAPSEQLNMVKQDDKKYQRKTEMWKRLPLVVTRILGPKLSCGLP